VLSHCFLSWAGQRARAPIFLLYMTCSSLKFHVIPALAASFLLAIFEALRERKGSSNA
jgi:hypothetical protein